MRYDVIVIGAGPAGSTTARECAVRGLSVLMLDKAKFPRDKPCGGGLTVRAAKLLPFDVSPVVDREIVGAQFTERQAHPSRRKYSDKITYLTQRSRLDTFLADKAVEAGAVFQQQEAVREINRSSTLVTVRTDSGLYEASSLVAADGANGVTARLAGISVKLLYGVGLEGNIYPKDGVPLNWQETMGFDMGSVPGGYGWIFPKGDHLNIGVGGWRYLARSLRPRLDRLVRFYGFETSRLSDLRGHLMPLRQHNSPLVDGNVLLVGDAAGLIDPLTGEGIYSAIWSGKTASNALAEYHSGTANNLLGYQAEIERVLLPELLISRQFHDVFNLWTGLFMSIELRSDVLWTAVARLLRGEYTYLHIKERLGAIWPLVEFTSDLMRVSPPLGRLAGLRDPTPPQRYFRWASHGAA